MLIGTFADLAADVLARPARLGPVRLVAVDGPAGAGKTTFARHLSEHLRALGATVAELHTDDVIEGWVGVDSMWPRLRSWLLDPLRDGVPGCFQKYDFHTKRFQPQWHEVPVPDVAVLEGVTSARAAVRPELTLSVYVYAPRELRLARGLERDGADQLPDWLRWMADEDRHFAADRTAQHVDVVVDSASVNPYDRRTHYVRRQQPPSEAHPSSAATGP